jgi:hypothetical protein
MLPSEEKTPALDMSQPVEMSKDATASLQNPLHDMYREQQLPKNAGISTTPAQQAQSARSTIFSTNVPSPVPQSQKQASPVSPHNSETNEADEEVWIERAKTIVEQTQNDPYQRLQALQQLQALYQSEHFRKDTGGVVGS